MNWKETVLKSSEIKWRRPKMKSVDDGKLDFIIHLPLTNLFRRQAKRAFSHGVAATLAFIAKHQESGRPIETSDIVAFLNECDLPELAKLSQDKNDEHEGKAECPTE